MTRKELSQIYYLTHDLERCERNLEELRASIQPKAQRLTGMPFANTGTTSDPTGEAAEKIVHCIETIEGYKQAILIRKTAIIEWINSLEDPLLRQIVNYRCLELLSWEGVSINIGGGNSAESCRQYFCRKIPKN